MLDFQSDIHVHHQRRENDGIECNLCRSWSLYGYLLHFIKNGSQTTSSHRARNSAVQECIRKSCREIKKETGPGEEDNLCPSNSQGDTAISSECPPSTRQSCPAIYRDPIPRRRHFLSSPGSLKFGTTPFTVARGEQ